jgi:riboflavin kinase/FMN adenylyltransferase
MRVFTHIDNIQGIGPTAVALGNFDGVHLGHAELIRRTVRYAKEHGLAPAVFTFSNDPFNVIAGKTLVWSIQTERDKEEMLRRLGVAYLFSFSFDEMFRIMTPQAFIEDLIVRAFGAKAVFCGFNFRFGAETAGNPDMLRETGAARGFNTAVMDPYRVGDTLVSSTVIRDLIADGSMEEAASYLGRPFSIAGEIDRGNGIGRGLGFPTANIALTEGLVVPAYGVYATESRITGALQDSTPSGKPKEMKRSTPDGVARETSGDALENMPSGGEWHRSVTNIGVRPTVGDSRLLAETHVFGVPDKDLYGHRIRVNFLSMIRPEKKFASLEELKAQVEIDKQSALAY